MTSSVLVGDVGGTSVRFALATRSGNRVSLSGFRKLEGDRFASFSDALSAYLSDAGLAPQAALFALAGPTDGREVRLTNRAWTVSAAGLESAFGMDSVRLVNDFTAMARAVPELAETDFEIIRPGEPVDGAPILVAGPGTGLGTATLLGSARTGWSVLSGEGGFTAYAPRNDLEWALFKLLEAGHGFVSHELVCAGSGLAPVHKALATLHGQAWRPMDPADVLAAAQAGDPVCLDICTIRSRALLGALGDLALTVGATGGVVIAGGVAKRLKSYLAEPESLDRFARRGPRTDYLARVPIRLMSLEEAPLLGAAALYFDQGYGPV